MLTGSFKILLNGELVTYTNYNDIPESFDNVIEFLPDYPPGPHTEEEHEYVGTYNLYLLDLLKRETNGSSD
jgi:hypothetical protein